MQENPAHTPQNLSYQDAGNGLAVWLKIDQEAGTEKIHNLRDGLLASKTKYQFQKAMTGGPLLGEGCWIGDNGDLEHMGYVDAVRHYLNPPDGVAYNAWYVMPDYNLKVIKPKSLHHGMGVESEYSGWPPWQPAKQDEVRCAEICYGQGIYMLSNGNVPNDFLQDPDEVRAYYQVTADLQPQFAASDCTEVGYWNGSSFVQLKDALIQGMDFSACQLRILYANGLQIFANVGSSDWTRTIAGVTFTLGKDAWVAYNPNTGYLNFSAIPSGFAYRFDYVYCPGKYEMIDGRRTPTAYGGIAATNFKVVWTNGYTVTETGSFPNDFTITGTLPTHEPADPPGPYPTPPPNSADLNFRHIQGMYGWFYRAYDASISIPADRPFWSKYSRYPDLDYNSATSEYYYRIDPAAKLSATTMTPSSANDIVRGWCAFAPGKIRVTGTARMQSGSTTGNGVQVRVRDGFEGPILWQQNVAAGNTVGHAHNLNFTVEEGDLLLFECDALGDGTNDTTVWVPTITYQESAGGFLVKNASGSTIASIDSEGNMLLSGSLTQAGNPARTSGSDFFLRNAGGAIAAAIDAAGNMILTGTVHPAQVYLIPPAGSLVIKNDAGDVVAFFSPAGHLYLLGNITTGP